LGIFAVPHGSPSIARQEDGMQTIRLNVDALKVNSFTTTDDAAQNAFAPTDLGSAVSETDGVAICKSCGPCCR
jgi:hypothetical protein